MEVNFHLKELIKEKSIFFKIDDSKKIKGQYLNKVNQTLMLKNVILKLILQEKKQDE